MDEKLIQSLWDRFDRSDATELIYEADGARLELKKAEPKKEIIYGGGLTEADTMRALGAVSGAKQGGYMQTAAYGDAYMHHADEYSVPTDKVSANSAAGDIIPRYDTGKNTDIKNAASYAAAPYSNAAYNNEPYSNASYNNATYTNSAESSGIYVRAPLPGTFYRAASPDDEPFVIIGKKVKQGEVVGIVESMKMMNEIVAHDDGIVAELIAENGAIVGYDEELMKLVQN